MLKNRMKGRVKRMATECSVGMGLLYVTPVTHQSQHRVASGGIGIHLHYVYTFDTTVIGLKQVALCTTSFYLLQNGFGSDVMVKRLTFVFSAAYIYMYG